MKLVSGSTTGLLKAYGNEVHVRKHHWAIEMGMKLVSGSTTGLLRWE